MLLDLTVGQVLDRAAERFPENDALVYVNRNLRYSYREFKEKCEQLAKGMIKLGLKKGDHVAVWAHNVPEWVILQFATAKAGVVLVTVNTYYKAHELEYLLRQSDSTTLFLVSGFKDVSYVDVVNQVVPELKTSEPGSLSVEKLPFLKNLVYMGEGSQDGMFSFQDIMDLGAQVSDEVLAEREAMVSNLDVINMQYTSGTTGFPKGVMLTHHNIVNNAFLVGEKLNLTEKDRYLIPVPFFHCFGCVLSTLNCVVKAATMVIIEEFNPQAVLESVHVERCTAINGVPTMFIAELQHPDFDKYDLTSLRTGIMAGATCPEEVMKQVMDRMHATQVTICYGLTETSPVLTQTEGDDTMENRTTTVGKALPHTLVKVVDPATDEELPPGTPGELVASGYAVMKGYYKMEEATSKSVRNGWLHSKDLAVMDEHGYFKIIGRVDDMIIRGGENVYPREIEEFLYTHPAVLDVSVVGVPSPKYGEEVCAFVKLKPGESSNEEELKDFCRKNISRFKVPKYIWFIDEYPMTASGKIQKYKLREIAKGNLG